MTIQHLLKHIDKRVRQFKQNRSGFIETAIWEFIARFIRRETNASDLEIINCRAEYLNREAADVLDYPVRP